MLPGLIKAGKERANLTAWGYSRGTSEAPNCRACDCQIPLLSPLLREQHLQGAGFDISGQLLSITYPPALQRDPLCCVPNTFSCFCSSAQLLFPLKVCATAGKALESNQTSKQQNMAVIPNFIITTVRTRHFTSFPNVSAFPISMW